MPRPELVGAICRPSDSGCGDDDGTQFICCVDGRHSEIHGIWLFGEDVVTPEGHPTVRINVGDFVGDYFATDYLIPTWPNVPMFVRKSINGSVKWIGFPSFLRNYGPPWTLNLLALCSDWVGRGSSTSKNLSNSSGGYSDSVLLTGICPLAYLQFITGVYLRTPAVPRVAPVAISLWRTTRTA